MRVHVIGPNLRDNGATFHVHAEGCADVTRSALYRGPEFKHDREHAYDYPTLRAVADEVHADIIAEGDDPGRRLLGRVQGVPVRHVGAGDGVSTYRERREARADRLDGWADKRETRGAASVELARARADLIPFGQPMMPGHHSYRGDVSYRGKIAAGYERGFTDLAKADSMRSRAEGIRGQAEHAIYSDDVDAIEQLTARIEGLEAERARIKAYNATARKGTRDVWLLDDRQREALESCARFQPAYFERKQRQMPSYALSNLSGNITKQRARLAQLIAAAARS